MRGRNLRDAAEIPRAGGWFRHLLPALPQQVLVGFRDLAPQLSAPLHAVIELCLKILTPKRWKGTLSAEYPPKCVAIVSKFLLPPDALTVAVVVMMRRRLMTRHFGLWTVREL